MRLLLDTHALLWWLADDPRLGAHARDRIGDPGTTVLVSVASLWEMQVKIRIGKLSADLGRTIAEIEAQGFDLLQIAPAHLLRLGTLPAHHKDPFDHLLLAQALAEGATFVSEDRHVPAYEVPHLACSAA